MLHKRFQRKVSEDGNLWKGSPRDRQNFRRLKAQLSGRNGPTEGICRVIQKTWDRIQMHRNADSFLQQAELAEELAHSSR